MDLEYKKMAKMEISQDWRSRVFQLYAKIGEHIVNILDLKQRNK